MCKKSRHQKNQERFNQLLDSTTETTISRADLFTKLDNQGNTFSDVEKYAFKKSNEEFIDFTCFERVITSKDAQPSKFKRILYSIADLVISRKQRIKIHSKINEQLWKPPPVFMTLLTAFQIGVFFYFYATVEKSTLFNFCGGCGDNETPFIFQPKHKHQLWRFFTHCFVHAGIDHLSKNMICQIIIGIPLEVAHRITKIGPLFILGVTCSAITMFARNPNGPFLGASGGDYALLFAHVSNLILNWKDMPYRRVQAFLVTSYVLSDFVEDSYSIVKYKVSRIAHGAHLNSAITGLIYGFFVLYYVEKSWSWKLVRYTILTAYLVYQTFSNRIESIDLFILRNMCSQTSKTTNREKFEQLLQNQDETTIPLSQIPKRIEDRGNFLTEKQKTALKSAKYEHVDFVCFETIITSKKAQSSRFKRILYNIADLVISRNERSKIHSEIDNNLWRFPPIFMLLITVIQIVIHFYYQFNNDNSTILDQCAFDPEKRKEIWRFLTHSLLHHGIDHLAKNMVAQIFIGIPLEIAHRITKIGPIYVLGIICTAIMNHAIYPEVHSVGASCGDYALVFVHVSNLILHWSQIPYHKTQALILFIYVGSDFTDLFYRFASTEEVEIAHFAHFAAAIIGLLYGFFILYYVKKGILWSILRVVSLLSYILAVLYACVYAYNTNIEEIFAKEHRDQL
ncbi:unnamed protein product [Caenorhabditis angaria]|uniref:Peptidase S54 rhomboid domain-containing protein n=1 Tax=Caenorhabditis angaria TaxID=860376 RepID=A0A9P1IIQ5_9PELO|nr:unnamed protein product [Caenorhabditis angaria]